MLFKRPAVTRFFSKVKKLLGMSSSSVNYSGFEYVDGFQYTSDTYKKALLDRYQSMEDAEGCRILKVAGGKKMKPDISQHEYVVVTIKRGEEKGYVVFERVPARRTEGTPSSSSMSVESRNSSANMSMASNSPSDAIDKVTFVTDAKPYPHHETTWTIKFEDSDQPAFYIAVNIAAAISECHPDYTLFNTNCYFYADMFQYMLTEECKGGVYTPGDVQAGSTQGYNFWKSSVKQGSSVEVNTKFSSQIKIFRETLEAKAARAAEVQRKTEERHQVELQQVERKVQRKEEERHQVELQQVHEQHNEELQQVHEQHNEELAREREAGRKREEELVRERERDRREIEELKKQLALNGNAAAQAR
ncbi:hypothetical protein C0992_003880 [Termitomyces sp. T32_za158]|nr:hypothetical protein C0992_003880 [Termitomyces sp. T32_za158]